MAMGAVLFRTRAIKANETSDVYKSMPLRCSLSSARVDIPGFRCSAGLSKSIAVTFFQLRQVVVICQITDCVCQCC